MIIQNLDNPFSLDHNSIVDLLSKLNNLSLFFKFIYFERASEHRRDRERGRERIPSGLCAVSTKPDTKLELINCEIMT